MSADFKEFVNKYLKHGDLKDVSHQAGIHPNTVYSWMSGRNKPQILSLVWFFRAISYRKNLSYECLWLEYLYHLEGQSDPGLMLDIFIKEQYVFRKDTSGKIRKE